MSFVVAILNILNEDGIQGEGVRFEFVDGSRSGVREDLFCIFFSFAIAVAI